MVIYKTTNLLNGKIYIGKDKRNDRKYLGSGKILRQAVSKYGLRNFSKEILEECKALLGIEIGIAKHFFDPGSFYHIFLLILIIRNRIRFILISTHHIFREKFLFKYYRLIIKLISHFPYIIEQLTDPLSADGRNGKYPDPFGLKLFL